MHDRGRGGSHETVKIGRSCEKYGRGTDVGVVVIGISVLFNPNRDQTISVLASLDLLCKPLTLTMNKFSLCLAIEVEIPLTEETGATETARWENTGRRDRRAIVRDI